jgi:hypothetical protein
MRIARTAIALVLLSAAAACSGGGGHDPAKAREAVEEMRDFARSKIKDPARAEKVVGLVDAYEKRIGALNGQLQAFLGELRALNADYDAPRERFQKLGDDFTAARRPLQTALVDTVQAMKAGTTPEEWKSLTKLEEEALRAGLQRERVEKKG